MKKLLLGAAFVFCILWQVAGQVVDLRFTNFKFNNSLSSVFLKSIEQDQYGFMWFGTTNGLHRFDGTELHNYLTSEGLSFGIGESNIYELYTDSKGWLWISLNSNLCYYDVQTDSIIIVANENQSRGLVDGFFVSCYAEDSNDELFVSTAESVYQFNRDSLTFQKVFSIEKGYISNFIIDSAHNFWVASFNGDGIVKYNPNTQIITKLNVPVKNDLAQSIPDLEIYDNKLWIATDGSGVFSYDFALEEFKNYPADSEYALNIQEIYLDKEDNLWIVDFTGLKQYVKDRDFFQGYYPEANNEYSISPYVKNVFQDRDHNYWTVHSPGGIGFCPKPKGINRFDSKINSPFRLSSDNVSTIAEDYYGNLWMGNPFNGIDVFNWTLGKTVTYHHDPNNQFSLGKGATQCIYRDSKQQMWIGSYWGGLQRYRPESDDFISYLHDHSNPNSLSINDVRAIVEDKEGNLWLSVHSKGIDKFNPSTNTFANYNYENNNLANNYTFQVALDSLDNIWVATAWGLSKLEPGATVFKNYVFSDKDEHSLSGNLVNTIFVDRLNRLWVGTAQGLNQYLPETDNFKRIVVGFANKNIVSINADNKDNIWVGTYYGLSRYTPDNGVILNLSKDDGLISNDFLPRSVFNNGANALFFGSVDGINYFNPLEMKYNLSPPEVYLTGLKILNQDVTNHNSKLINKNLILVDKIKLNYSQKIIELDFMAMNFVGTQNNKYAFYLDGFEKDWNYVGNKHSATYTNLNPGKYTFRVKAANNEGIWNNDGVSLEIIVIPPLWKTSWFKILVILFLIFLIIIGINAREKNLIHANELLEKKVEERTYELNLQKEELEKQKKLLEESNHFKSKFVSILAHDLKGPIASLMQLILLLKQRINSNQLESITKIIELSTDTATTTNELLDELLLWGKAQTNNIHLEFELLDIGELIQQTIGTLSNMAAQKEIHINSSIKIRQHAYADKNSVKTIMRNLLSNAIKFSKAGSQIDIEVKQKQNEMIVKVSDNGVGMSDEMLHSIFNNNLKKSSSGTSGEKGTGMGISLCMELIKLNGGKMWANSELSKGSVFCFSIPLNSIENN